MKKLCTILASLTLVVLCVFLLPTEAQAASESDLTFKLNSGGGSYSVTDCKESASGSLTIPATYNGKPVTGIGDEAFSYCKGLTSITIPNSVTSIDYGAFQNCSSLTSVSIGDSVTSIEKFAFYNCSRLTHVYITNPSAWLNITFGDDDANPMHYADKLHILDADGNEVSSVVLDSSVTKIPDYAFYSCSSLTSITIPDSVTSIGKHAFYDCTSLTSITIPDSVTSIGYAAFIDCTSLTSIDIPDSVTSIGDYAFRSCSGLTSVTIGNSVTSIGNYAFKNCTSLTHIYITNLSAWLNITFGDDANPMYYADKLHILDADGNEARSVVLDSSVTKIPDYAFRGCSSLTSIDIPDSVTSIGDYAFRSCSGLTSVTIGNSVTSIGKYAFYECSSLTSINIPDSVTSIGSSAFYSCDSLMSITIPDGVTSIGYGVFYSCDSLTSITIPDSVTSIGSSAFLYCYSLRNVIYCGVEEQWNAISIGGYNTALTNATRSYHNMVGGDCHTLQTCAVCGERGGDYQHTWIEASCTNKKFCYLCGATEGDYGHQWVAVTCTAPKYCSLCGVIEGEPLGHDWTAANCTDPTTCSRCSLTSDQPLGHKFDHDKDYICNTCGYSRLVEEPTLKFYSTSPSLSFQDYIGMQILIRNADVAKYDKVYVIAVQEGPDGAVETRLEGIPFYGVYQVFDQQVLSWSMTEQVTMTLYGEIGDVVYQGASLQASVESLALQMLKNSGNDTLKCRVLVDMLNYGAAVQTAFKHNADKLPNTALEAYAHLGTTSTPEMTASSAESGSGSIKASQVSISMQAKVELQILFMTKIDTYTPKATLNGSDVAVTVDNETYASYGWTIVKIAAGAANLRDYYEFALYDANGNAVSPVYQLTVEAYAKNQLGGAYKDVAVAMMRYGDSVAAYANK